MTIRSMKYQFEIAEFRNIEEADKGLIRRKMYDTCHKQIDIPSCRTSLWIIL